jgi:DNA-directed RNA polymerase specialized sigma24 family protein
MERIKRKYKYSIHDGDDLAQEAYFIAVKACKSYNPETGPLYNFLSVAVGNRIINFIRNKRIKEIHSTSLFGIEEERMSKIVTIKTTNREFWDIIDDNLTGSLRVDYLKLRQGIDIPKLRKVKLLEELRRIADEYI